MTADSPAGGPCAAPGRSGHCSRDRRSSAQLPADILLFTHQLLWTAVVLPSRANSSTKVPVEWLCSSAALGSWAVWMCPQLSPSSLGDSPGTIPRIWGGLWTDSSSRKNNNTELRDFYPLGIHLSPHVLTRSNAATSRCTWQLLSTLVQD